MEVRLQKKGDKMLLSMGWVHEWKEGWWYMLGRSPYDGPIDYWHMISYSKERQMLFFLNVDVTELYGKGLKLCIHEVKTDPGKFGPTTYSGVSSESFSLDDIPPVVKKHYPHYHRSLKYHRLL